MARCSECKCCEAQSGFDLCVFCEDKVACPGRLRQVTPLPVPKVVLVNNVKAPAGKASARVVNPKSPWRGPAKLYFKGASVIADQTKQKEQTITMPTKKPRLCSCGCGTPLTNRHPYIKGHNKPKEDGQRVKQGLCACGCGEPAKSNRSPYIKGHNPNAKRKTKNAKPARPVASTASSLRDSDSTPRPGVATICVTETNLDNFWSKLSLEEKAALYQQQLENA